MATGEVKYRQCDRCNKRKPVDEIVQDDNEDTYTWRTLKFHYVPPWYDLCPECVVDFGRFMRNEAILPIKIIKTRQSEIVE